MPLQYILMPLQSFLMPLWSIIMLALVFVLVALLQHQNVRVKHFLCALGFWQPGSGLCGVVKETNVAALQAGSIFLTILTVIKQWGACCRLLKFQASSRSCVVVLLSQGKATGHTRLLILFWIFIISLTAAAKATFQCWVASQQGFFVQPPQSTLDC